MEKNVMKGNARTLLKQFGLKGTVLGLKYFYLYPDRISRCFWAVTLILILVFACNLTFLLYGRFNEMPTRITIENQYESLATLPFPAITLCSPNQMTLRSMRHFNKTLIDGNTTVNLETALPQLLGFYVIVNNINNDELYRLQKLIDENRYTVPEVMALMPQTCDDFLKLCIFRMEVRRCSDLFRPVLTRQGLCCAFNNVYHFKEKRNEKDMNFQPQMPSTSGVQDALRVVVDYEPEDAIPRTLFHVGAIRVYFTDWTEFPSEDQTQLVFPRVEAFLALHGTFTYCSDEVATLPSWSRKCLFANERRLPFFWDYHNSECDILCYIRAVERHCHCQPVFVPRVGNGRACDVTKLQCINQVKELSSDCDCPRDCESRTYSVDLSLGNLHGLPYMTFNPYSNIKFNESTTIMHFFFPSSVYVKTKQETVMSLISLASNLGGIFGLCMGVSVVSVLEMAFFTRKAVENYLRKRLRSAVEHQIQRYRTTVE